MLIRLVGKGNRERPIFVGAKAARRSTDTSTTPGPSTARPTPRRCGSVRGRLAPSGITQLVKTRGERAGIERLHPHAFRHAWAHANVARGMQEGESHHPPRGTIQPRGNLGKRGRLGPGVHWKPSATTLAEALEVAIETLYYGLGGTDVITAVVDDFPHPLRR